MSASAPLGSLGRRRFADVPGYLTGRGPRSKGGRYLPDPPRRGGRCGDALLQRRAPRRSRPRADRGAVAAGLRIQEALDEGELDLDPRRGPVMVRSGKSGRRREVGSGGYQVSRSSQPSAPPSSLATPCSCR